MLNFGMSFKIKQSSVSKKMKNFIHMIWCSDLALISWKTLRNWIIASQLSKKCATLYDSTTIECHAHKNARPITKKNRRKSHLCTQSAIQNWESQSIEWSAVVVYYGNATEIQYILIIRTRNDDPIVIVNRCHHYSSHQALNACIKHRLSYHILL